MPGKDRAGVAAAHGDYRVSCAYDLGGQRLGVGAGHVDAEFGERLDDGGVEVADGGGARGAGDHGAAGAVAQEGGGHLGASGVVDADEQHFGVGVLGGALGLGGCGQPVGGEAYREDRQVAVDRRVFGTGWEGRSTSRR